MLNSPVLTQIITLLEVLATDLTGICYLWGFVRALVYHQIVGLGETPLAILANELTLRTHLATEIRPAVIVVDSHYSKHFDRRYIFPSFRCFFPLFLAYVRRARAQCSHNQWVKFFVQLASLPTTDTHSLLLLSALLQSLSLCLALTHTQCRSRSLWLIVCARSLALSECSRCAEWGCVWKALSFALCAMSAMFDAVNGTQSVIAISIAMADNSYLLYVWQCFFFFFPL